MVVFLGSVMAMCGYLQAHRGIAIALAQHDVEQLRSVRIPDQLPGKEVAVNVYNKLSRLGDGKTDEQLHKQHRSTKHSHHKSHKLKRFVDDHPHKHGHHKSKRKVHKGIAAKLPERSVQSHLR
jgi:hypothetical protein